MSSAPRAWDGSPYYYNRVGIPRHSFPSNDMIGRGTKNTPGDHNNCIERVEAGHPADVVARVTVRERC